jgi:hypothetical protein
MSRARLRADRQTLVQRNSRWAGLLPEVSFVFRYMAQPALYRFAMDSSNRPASHRLPSLIRSISANRMPTSECSVTCSETNWDLCAGCVPGRLVQDFRDHSWANVSHRAAWLVANPHGIIHRSESFKKFRGSLVVGGACVIRGGAPPSAGRSRRRLDGL